MQRTLVAMRARSEVVLTRFFSATRVVDAAEWERRTRPSGTSIRLLCRLPVAGLWSESSEP